MPKEKAVRKPLTAMLTPDRESPDGDVSYGSLIVVCDDGAVFGYDWREGYWSPYAPVPGTAANVNASE